MRTELEALEARLASYPSADARRLDAARSEREQAAAQLREGTERLQALQQGGGSAKAIAIERQRIKAAQDSGRRAVAVERKLTPQVPNRGEWERETEPQRGRAKELRAELGARREAHTEAALASPPAHLSRALGRSPLDPGKRMGWERAARAVEGYRFDRGLRGMEPLGERPSDPAGRKAFEKIEAELGRAQRRLGLAEKPGPVREL